MAKKQTSFPKDFFWGASTAAYQVEGGNHTQWTVWELQQASNLAKTAKRRYGDLPNWASIREQASQPDNYVAGKAVDHYEQYQHDFAIAKKLNLNALRFGIEWARVEPSEGQWDNQAWNHYRDYIKALKKQGIEPFLNIWHWTVPVWFERKGGFAKGSNLAYFKRFVEEVVERLGGELQYVLTINEPNTYVATSFIIGRWPPQERNLIKGLIIYKNLAKAHRIAYRVIKKRYPTIQVGVATQLGNVQALRPHNVIDQASTKMIRYAWNWWFVNRVRRHQDFVGFNYYFTDYYRGFRRENPKVPLNDMGWYMEPEGLHPLLVRVAARYKKPIIVTENGLADAEDQHRQWWIEQTIIALERALSEGVDVRGYFHWSLLDNFEWADGWWPKFGLVSVNRKTMARTVRPSAKWFAQEIVRLKQGSSD